MIRPYKVVASSKDRPTWLEWRKKLITASDVHKVLKGGKTRATLLAEKRGEVEPKNLDYNRYVMGGRFHESGVMAMWKHFSGMHAHLTPLLCVSLRYPWLGATADGLAWSSVAGEAGVVEIKTCNTGTWGNVVPGNYALQHDTQMYVLGKSFGWVVVSYGFAHIPDTYPRGFSAQRRSEYEREVIPKLEEFAKDAKLIG